jgi:hypothetical protein
LGRYVDDEPAATYRMALVRAAEILGGARALAQRLQVSMPDLTRWLAGVEKPSIGTFLKVIDILLEESRKPHHAPSANAPLRRTDKAPDDGESG